MRKLFCVIALSILSSIAFAADDDLYGTYKLISSTRKTLDTGESFDSYGKNPSGYITYGRDGRMMAIITNDGRPKAESVEKMTDQQRLSLFRSVIAYGGTFTYRGDSITHHIDISWNEVWTGTDVIRDIRKEGSRLIYTTRPAPFASDGKMSITTLIWEKVKS
jgi:hypothetical protein